MTGGGTPPARHESETVEVAVATLGPPEPGSAPVPAPNDAGTPAPAGRSVQVQEGAPSPRVAQQETPEPRVARQRSPEAVPVYQEDLQEKNRQTKVAEPPGQAKTRTLAQGQGKV